MPRSYRRRRQEVRSRRRQARRSLNLLLLDDELNLLEEDGAEPPLYEMAPRRNHQGPLPALASDANQHD